MNEKFVFLQKPVLIRELTTVESALDRHLYNVARRCYLWLKNVAYIIRPQRCNRNRMHA